MLALLQTKLALRAINRPSPPTMVTVPMKKKLTMRVNQPPRSLIPLREPLHRQT